MVIINNFTTFALAKQKSSLHTFGALVQLVRMPACHAGGHEFESRTHRFKYFERKLGFSNKVTIS